MKQITWGEFKRAVEEKARATGIQDPDAHPVAYIDVLGYSTVDDLSVHETDDYAPDEEGRKPFAVQS